MLLICNFQSERDTLKGWNEKWGFTKELYGEMYSDAKNVGSAQSATPEKRTKAPETTTGMIGWRKPNPVVRRLSESARRNKSIHKHFGWPIDGVY